jgi:hypothetical protein
MKYALTQAGIKGLSCRSRSGAWISAITTRTWPVQKGPVLLRDPRATPSAEPSRVFATWDEFDAWRQKNGKLRPGAPRVAVSFYKATYYSDETECSTR